MLKIYKFIVGDIETNSYILHDDITGYNLLVDPGEVDENLTEKIMDLGNDKFQYILLTHGHFDHIRGVAYYSNLTKAKIVVSDKDEILLNEDNLNLSVMHKPLEHFKADILVDENDELQFAGYKIKVIKTPGHTAGSVCYMIDNIMFTGDTIMKGTVGRTDFPTSSYDDMLTSIEKIAKIKLNYTLLCGHGEPTYLSYEKQANPYFKGEI